MSCGAFSLPMLAGLLAAMGVASAQPPPSIVTSTEARFTVRQIEFLIPNAYRRLQFLPAFSIGACAHDWRPAGDPRACRRSDDAIAITVNLWGDRFSGDDAVRRGISIWRSFPFNQPLERADVLDNMPGRTVPDGLEYWRAVRSPGTDQPDHDLFLLTPPIESLTGEALPEAMFCVSAGSRLAGVLYRRGENHGPLRCEWQLVWRGFYVSVLLERSHLQDWRRTREGITGLLDSFVVGGPAEAGPPPNPLPR